MTLGALVWKDARRELQSGESLLAGGLLVVAFSILFLFAFPTHDPRAAAAAIWVPILFGGAAVATRGIAREADLGTLDLLRSLPVPLAWHGWSRTILNALILAILAAVAAGATALLFAAPMSAATLVTVALAVPGIAVVATLSAALASQAGAREMLAPILMVPALVPLLQAGLDATFGGLSGATVADLQAPLLVLLGYDLLAVGVAWFLWPSVLEAE